MVFITQSYRDYIKSPRWAAKRQEAFRYYGKKCKACGKWKKTLTVHHLDYKRLGNEPMYDLMILCWDCHGKVTKYHRRRRRAGLRKNTYEAIRLIQNNK